MFGCVRWDRTNLGPTTLSTAYQTEGIPHTNLAEGKGIEPLSFPIAERSKLVRPPGATFFGRRGGIRTHVPRHIRPLPSPVEPLDMKLCFKAVGLRQPALCWKGRQVTLLITWFQRPSSSSMSSHLFGYGTSFCPKSW